MEKQIKDIVDLTKAGSYHYGLGRRKTSTARARIYFDAAKELKGKFFSNSIDVKSYFPVSSQSANVYKPLEAVGVKKGDIFVTLKISGGGKSGQSEAARLAIARALIESNEDYKPVLRAAGFLTRDPRMKERKKPGLRGARRAPQWTKR